MRKLEYKQEKTKSDTLAQLNEEGQSGWELVLAGHDVQPNRLSLNSSPNVIPVLIFKREIVEE